MKKVFAVVLGVLLAMALGFVLGYNHGLDWCVEHPNYVTFNAK